MVPSFDGFRGSGTFSVGGLTIAGDLILKGEASTLDLFAEEPFSSGDVAEGCILGSLHDRTKVSLIGCITVQGPGRGYRGSESYHFSTVFPHFVVFAADHITASDKKITAVSFEVNDAYALFYDFPAFGSVTGDKGAFMELLAEAERAEGRELVAGKYPLIYYFTGKEEIFKAKTAMGVVSATHAPSLSMPGPRGIKVDNKIRINVAFDEPKTIDGAMAPVHALLRFLEIVAGRTQKVRRLYFLADEGTGRPSVFNVYWSMSPPSEEVDSKHEPHPADMPVQAAKEPDKFGKILAQWLAKDDAWIQARVRFSSGMEQGNLYTIDRLVGAANMFDILPATAVPTDIPLTAELEEARDKARMLFKPLAKSPERDSVLGALGRIGKASLKRKIRARAAMILRFTGTCFSDLELVVDEAVNCRNYFVHGSVAKLDYANNSDLTSFFTDALEFIFAASDLVECGWNIALWSQRWTTMSHPFDRFRKTYADQLEGLKEALAEASKSSVLSRVV